MSFSDIYKEDKRRIEERNKITYGQHYCDTCGKETRCRITHDDFRTNYTCMVCGAID